MRLRLCLFSTAALIAGFNHERPVPCFADDHLLFGDKKVIDKVESLMDREGDPICFRVRRSKLLENWRLAYLHGNDAQATVLLKQIFHELEGADDILPLLQKLGDVNMYDEDKNSLPERLAPTRFFNDLLVSTRKIIGPKNFLVADVCLYVGGWACDNNDSKGKARLCLEELNIRRLYPKREPVRYLRVLNNAALFMSHSGQTAQAKEMFREGIVFIDKNGLGKTETALQIMRNFKRLDAKAGAQNFN